MTGIWKEGRVGAASLVYHGLDDAALAQVMEHHAAVGIRATVLGPQAEEVLALLRHRAWDVAMAEDGDHGVIQVDETIRPLTAALYHVTTSPGEIAGPLAGRQRVLPSHRLPTGQEAARQAIEAVVERQAWAIWRIDAAVLADLGRPGHAAVLRWLGDEHARIWCAPIRDIHAWG